MKELVDNMSELLPALKVLLPFVAVFFSAFYGLVLVKRRVEQVERALVRYPLYLTEEQVRSRDFDNVPVSVPLGAKQVVCVDTLRSMGPTAELLDVSRRLGRFLHGAYEMMKLVLIYIVVALIFWLVVTGYVQSKQWIISGYEWKVGLWFLAPFVAGLILLVLCYWVMIDKYATERYRTLLRESGLVQVRRAPGGQTSEVLSIIEFEDF